MYIYIYVYIKKMGSESAGNSKAVHHQLHELPVRSSWACVYNLFAKSTSKDRNGAFYFANCYT